MFLSFFGLGALAGALIHDGRVISTVFPAAAVLAVIGFRDDVFANWFSGLAWFFGNLACFEVGLLLCGFAAFAVRQYLEARRPDLGSRMPVSREN